MLKQLIYGGRHWLNFLTTSRTIPIHIMKPAKDLTKNQKDTLKKLLLKQKQWEQNKQQIKTAKKKTIKKVV